MSEHIIYLYGVFNNTINEIPTRGDNAGCSYNIILKTSIVHGVNKFLKGIIYILIFYLWNKELKMSRVVFSSPDPKGQVSYCHHWASVRPLTFHILINSSETTGPIWTKLWWNGPWMAPFQNCVRWSRLPTKMATKLKIDKRGDVILIVHCCFSISQNELKF
jgi:hypothetical protein